MSKNDPYKSMSTSDLERRRKEAESRLEEVCRDIVAVVAKDVPRFMTREARLRWLEDPDFAATMDGAKLKGLKAGLEAAGAESIEAVGRELGGLDLWLSASDSENHKSLESNTAVWRSLQTIACKLSGVLSEFDFPADKDAPEGITYALVYRTPAYFIDRDYCPSLIESYWRIIQEHQQIAGAVAQTELGQKRADQEARWKEIF